jgi:hypothetical protein
MITTRLAIAALVSVGLASAPFAAQAKNYRHVRHGHYGHTTAAAPSGGYNGAVSTAGVSTPRSGTYGSSGNPVGTVTAPSVGSYNWPSVGVTNATPTWSNTNPR